MIKNINHDIDVNLKVLYESTDGTISKYAFLGEEVISDEDRFVSILESENLIDPLIVDICKLSKFGLDVSEKGGWLKYLESLDEQKIEQSRKQIILDQKLVNESKLLKWQVKTFWWFFVIAIFGGMYSGYDIILNLTKKEDVKQELISKEQLESELSKLRILISDQKTADSLRISKTLSDSLSK